MEEVEEEGEDGVGREGSLECCTTDCACVCFAHVHVYVCTSTQLCAVVLDASAF